MQELINKTIIHGVYIVTTKSGERKNGMTAAWVSQVSFKPPLIMAAIAPARYTYGLDQVFWLFCCEYTCSRPEGIG
ncbi:hypothetical protein BLFGPEAP_02223 [Candidatus Methanoperedenaceae archaeon GB50]|nr:hypothetical protein BLFGPEAP_02223 [Candidatus Methanoperedenaceae archaeon GB50]